MNANERLNETTRSPPRRGKRKRGKSLRGAINAFCRACIYDPHNGDGTWRQQVGACTSEKCPLFPVRPLPSEGSDDDRPESGQDGPNLAPNQALPGAEEDENDASR